MTYLIALFTGFPSCGVSLPDLYSDRRCGVTLVVLAMDEATEQFFAGGDPPLGVDDHVDNFRIMKTWVQDCRQHHVACNRDPESFLPTRLLDLQAFRTGQDIKLVSLRTDGINNQPFRQQYVTLSHCWGPPVNHPITTTKASLKDRTTRISIDELSNTFRDAVRITRDLGERYLWIDSLCIVQDDGDDWAREAELMAEVYGKSFCTLAALDSKDSTEGCQLVPKIQKIGTFLDFDSGDSQNDPYSYCIRIFEGEPREWHEEYGDNPYRHGDYGDIHPLRTRAWTLQERELSRRNIHFGSHQMLWECRELKASTQLPWHHKKPEDDFEPWPIRNDLSENLAPDGPVLMRDRWYGLMEDYSFRRLTNETDKLAALSGLAQNFQHAVPQAEYLAGIWSTHLPAALLWRTRYTARRPLSYIAPTWSWASIVGKITYESQRLDRTGKRIDDPPQERPSDHDFGSLSIERMSTRPKHNDKYGAILSGSLSWNGALLAGVDSNPQLRKFEDDYQGGSTAILSKDGEAVGLLYPDVLDEMPYTGELFCLRIRGEPYPSQIPQPSEMHKGQEVSDLVMGLVLTNEPKIGDEFQYRRIGLARWVTGSLFESSRPSVVTLL